MTLTLPTLYRVYSAPNTEGGKVVAVFPDAAGLDAPEMQRLAAQSGAPVSMFIQQVSVSDVVLRTFTPEREKGESDSGALAALDWLYRAGRIADVTEVVMQDALPAQLCGGEWLLRQGDAHATALELKPLDAARTLGLGARALGAFPVTVADAGRPNLVLVLRDQESLDAARPDDEAIAALNRETGTRGLIAVTTPGRRGEHVDFRTFGPLKGFTEDNASSNTYASLLASLSLLGLLPTDEPLLRASQGEATGRPARLTAQALLDGARAREIWVGGSARAVQP